MSGGPLRLVVAVAVLLLLLRAAVGAWRHRDLAIAVWRGVTWRHAVGALALLALVGTVGTLLLAAAPLQTGLGELVGSVGNAVFTPLEEAASRAGPAPPAGPDWLVIGLATVFLAFLTALLPWLAFVEEEIFRAGLEEATVGGELRSALAFGLVHMVMLVPLGAALAIAIAGFAYGRIYRRAHAPGEGVAPPPVAGLFRQTRRARRAAARARLRAAREALDGGEAVAVLTSPAPEQRQAAGVYASTVWHTTFNTLVVALLWVAIVWDAAA